MNSSCGTLKNLMMWSKYPFLPPTFGFQTFSSMSCKYAALFGYTIITVYKQAYDKHTSTSQSLLLLEPVPSLDPIPQSLAVLTWGSLLISHMCMWGTMDWCATTNPSRLWRPAAWTSTTSHLMCRTAASPSRAGYTSVSTHHYALYLLRFLAYSIYGNNGFHLIGMSNETNPNTVNVSPYKYRQNDYYPRKHF